MDSLISMNIFDIANLPAEFSLTERQQIDINAHATQTIYADRDRISGFLSTLQYPLYYLDYETIFPAIPLFDNSSPYQQIPFQFSLHIQQTKGGDARHLEFLHTELTDPRSDFVKALIDSCGTKGSVIVYNMGFESRINGNLAFLYPQSSISPGSHQFKNGGSVDTFPIQIFVPSQDDGFGFDKKGPAGICAGIELQ